MDGGQEVAAVPFQIRSRRNVAGGWKRAKPRRVVPVGVTVVVRVSVELLAVSVEAVRVGGAARPVFQAANTGAAVFDGSSTERAIGVRSATGAAVLIVACQIRAGPSTVRLPHGAGRRTTGTGRHSAGTRGTGRSARRGGSTSSVTTCRSGGHPRSGTATHLLRASGAATSTASIPAFPTSPSSSIGIATGPRSGWTGQGSGGKDNSEKDSGRTDYAHGAHLIGPTVIAVVQKATPGGRSLPAPPVSD